MNNNQNLVLPKRFESPSALQFIFVVICLALVIISLQGAGVVGGDIHLTERIPVAWEFIKDLFPPSFERIDKMAAQMWVTIQMAIAGTFIGVLISLPLGFIASSNFTPHKVVKMIARTVISLFRTIPDLIWALFFVITVGLGPLAGTLALVIDTIGFCSRFFAEAIEEADPQPIQGLEALGASKIAVIPSAVIPSVLPSFTNTSLFSLEKAIRSSVVLGLVGAGGIGIELKVAMETFRYAEASTIILAIFVMVIIVERISSSIRAKIIKN